MRVRLRDTVEIFHAATGDTWITHGAARANMVIRGSSARDRALLAALRGEPVDATELAEHLRSRGHELTRRDAEDTIAQLLGMHVLEEPAAARRSGLDAADLERYDRQLAYFADLNGQDAAYRSQRRLADARVLILGCGGLGSWAALALLCSGVRHLSLVDGDRVEMSNLNRQILYGTSEVGMSKVAAARKALTRFDPRAEITLHHEQVADPDRLEELVTDMDFVVATADKPVGTIAAWVNQACLRTETPWISAGQFPPEVRIGPLYVPGDTACHRCAERSAQRTHPHYAELANARATRPVFAATTGPASGLIGSVIANEVVALLGGLHPPATLGHAITIDLRTLAVNQSAIERDPECPGCGA